MGRYCCLGFESTKGSDVATIAWEPSWLGRLFGLERYEFRVFGSGTVWYELDTGEFRNDFSGWLCGLHRKWEHDRKNGAV